jgi:hypothetical protein
MSVVAFTDRSRIPMALRGNRAEVMGHAGGHDLAWRTDHRLWRDCGDAGDMEKS